MAGTIPLSMTQQFDVYGQPLAGGQLYIIQAGTVSTPQDAFQDTGLTIKQPYPMTLDAAGRVPQFFLADPSSGGNSTVKIRLQDKNGVVQLASDGVLVIGPSGGTGGGGAIVDPTQLIQTGNMIIRYGFGVLTGYVRLNNLTIGSVTSGATERANADCQNLFQYLWGIDPNLVVSGGRGANALADWTASKQLALPDWRGYAIGALDDMGNAPAGRLSAAFFGSSPIVLGAAGGAESHILLPTEIQVPQHQHGVFLTDPGHTHSYVTATASVNSGGLNGGPAFGPAVTGSSKTGMTIGSAVGVGDGLTSLSPVGGAAQGHTSLGPRKLATFYIKL